MILTKTPSTISSNQYLWPYPVSQIVCLAAEWRPPQGRQGHRGSETAGEDLYNKDESLSIQRDADRGVRALFEEGKVQHKEGARSDKLVPGEKRPEAVAHEHKAFLLQTMIIFVLFSSFSWEGDRFLRSLQGQKMILGLRKRKILIELFYFVKLPREYQNGIGKKD